MQSQQLQLLEAIGTWFAGLATLAAVILALSLQRLSDRGQRPKLVVEYEKNNRGDNRYVAPSASDDASCSSPVGSSNCEELWIRVRVFNDSMITARDVELRFISIRAERDDGSDDPPSWWFKLSNFNATSIAIPPRFSQHYDVAWAKNVIGSPDDLSFYLAIVRRELLDWEEEKERMQKATANRLQIGSDYTLLFAVVSSNADAKYYELKLKVLIDRKQSDPPLTQEAGVIVLRERVRVQSLTELSPKKALHPAGVR